MVHAGSTSTYYSSTAPILDSTVVVMLKMCKLVKNVFFIIFNFEKLYIISFNYPAK
jgi:hypothetical protein